MVLCPEIDSNQDIPEGILRDFKLRGLKMKPLEGRKRRFGDRNDGFLVRNLDPMGKLIPYIMRSKSDSWVLFEDRIDRR